MAQEKLNAVEKQQIVFLSTIKKRIGQRFGKLTVLGLSSKKDKRGRVLWDFSCECGNVITRDYYKLKYRKRTDCCCVRKEQGKGSNFRSLFARYKAKASYRSLDFNLTIEQFKLFTIHNCYYCNRPPLQKTQHVGCRDAPYFYNGIDRKNSNIGYYFNNCVSCCGFCNSAKGPFFTAEEFKLIMDLRIKNNPNQDPWYGFKLFKQKDIIL